MEDTLNKLSKLNERLISEKDDLRKKLFEKCINSFEDLSYENSSFFDNVSIRIKDKEFDEFRIKYEKLKSLIFYINQLIEED